MSKSFKAYKTIGEVVKIINLNSKSNYVLSSHTIRYWEKEFKQIKPLTLNGNRRYYDIRSIELLKKVKFLLKDQGMTIKGVKKILNSKDPLKLDELSKNSITTSIVKNKLEVISNKIKELKNLK
tara:strand:- start:75 stop:446 length:372 start_codon:yes stop_codon:yes gene_type:complete